jgi:hypothetical protein
MNNLKIETKSRKNVLSFIAYGMASFFSLMMPFYLFMSIFKRLIIAEIIAVSIMFFFGILSVRILLWLILGKETLLIENNKLIILKSGTFWIKKKKEFPLNLIRKVSLRKTFYEENSPSETVHFFSRQMYIFKIQNTGRIEFILSNYSSFRCLDNLELFEAAAHIKEIETVISTSV